MIPLRDDISTQRFPLVTTVLIAINVAVFVAQPFLLPRWGLSLQSWYYLVGARPFELSHHIDVPPFSAFPWWATLFSSLFVHGGWLHLIFNMLYLWIFGNNVEDVMTRPRFVAFYFLCGMAATTAQVLVAPDSGVPLVGASGAIAGVLGAYLVLFPRARVLTVVPLLVVFPVFDVPAWVMLLIWFGLQALSGVQSFGSGQTGIAFFAHIGGFVAGMGLALLLARRRPRRRARRRV